MVSCFANSNFAALYEAIGSAVDKALNISDDLYYRFVRSARTLGQKAERVKQLVEKYGVGIIKFDKIHLIDFSSSKENSFEGLMTLANQTKVAIAAVGTEDAYEKMFNSKLRTARRLGPTISGHKYCSNKEYFAFLVKSLFNYQWTNEVVIPNDEIIESLYKKRRNLWHA